MDERYHPDPLCLPNFHTVDYPNFYFHQVKVFGFPTLRYAKQLKTDMQFDPYYRTYDVSNTFILLSTIVLYLVIYHHETRQNCNSSPNNDKLKN